jgi:hypothetical protein
MKKILRRILAVVLILLVAGIAAGVRYFTYDPDKQKEDDLYGYATDVEGMTYTMVADKHGTTYVVVTDAEGNRYAAEYDGTTVGNTVGGINGEVSIDDVPTNFTGSHVEVSNDINKFQGEISTTMPTLSQQDNTTTTGDKKPTDNSQGGTVTTKPQAPDKQENKLEAYRIDKYQQIFKSGTYLMTMTTNDESMGNSPVTMAIKNGNMYVEMAMDMEGTTMNCAMLYLKGKDTMYLIFNDWKKYCKMPKDMMGEDMDISSMMSEMGTEDIGKITVSEVEINGEKLILESYVSTDGTTVNYYFQDDVLVRRDNVFSDGHVDSTFFAVLTTDVPDSYFEIPKGYGYINLSFLDALA